MRVKYVGRLDAVSVPLPDGSEPVVEHGKSIEVDDEYGLLMLEQEENWQPAGDAAKKLAEANAKKQADASGESAGEAVKEEQNGL